jgi:hypothetical protein
MRYRPASTAPGGKRLPSTELETDRGDDGASVRVAKSSEPAAHPQAEQKRLLSAMAIPHEPQFVMYLLYSRTPEAL